MMHSIEVDDDVFTFLQNHAEPLKDDANSVLRRLLLGAETKPRITSSSTAVEIPRLPSGVPAALEQILEVTYLVKKLGYTRKKATNLVAKKRDIAPQTVIDKYCRQLNKQAFEIDRLLEHDLEGFKLLLKKVFVNHHDVIEDFFRLLL
jgi:negative regulator of replication initiation